VRPRTLAPLALAAALAAASAGCVERRLLVRSEPAGARVRVNGVPSGTTPAEIPFAFYGIVRLEIDPLDADGDGTADFRRFVAPVDLKTPWYEWFPLDFFADNLLPWTVRDHHEFEAVLEPAPRLEGEALEAARREAEAVKEREGAARAEAEAEAAGAEK